MIDIALSIPIFFIGVILLYKGSDVLVDGTAKTASQLGVSSLIISVVLVGFGTSSPEFAISVGAAIEGHTGISLGNIIGSCIANLLLVLGISAIVRPISVRKGIIKREMPIVFGATILLLLISFLGLLDAYHHIGGIIFLGSFTVFVIYFYRCAQKERDNNTKYNGDSLQKNIIFVILGITGVVVGAWFLIESAVSIATFFSIDPFVIALSMVAIGTSLPELVVSVMAAHKNKSDIVIGNVLGSNVFNILLILGVSALFVSLNAIDSITPLLILLITTSIFFPILYTGRTISRKEGLFLLFLYSIFIWYIFFV